MFVSHCPERVLPGRIMIELVENDRIVGGTTTEATKATVAFYNTFVEGEVLSTDAKTAEMAKLTENSFRDTNIALANELSILCDKFDIDVWELIALTTQAQIAVMRKMILVAHSLYKNYQLYIKNFRNNEVKIVD